MSPHEETTPLDPPDWEEFKALGRRIVDDMADYLAGIRDRPVWQPVPPDVQARLGTALPRTPTPVQDVYEEFRTTVMPYPRGNIHPRFWGWANGSGVPVAAYADLLASVVNCTLGSGENAAMMVEHQVLEWLKEAMRWPADGSGILTSGASMGQIIALAAARRAKSGTADIRGLGALADGRQFTVYGSTQTHHSVEKAVELLGIGGQYFRQTPVDAAFRIDTGALRRAIRADRDAGLHPLCLVGNAGTVNTGAVDPLDELLAIAREEDLWFHVDGAFGAFAQLLPTHRTLLAGMSEADSLVFDLHKWLYMPFDVSCVLVRRADALESTFSSSADYISSTDQGPAAYSLAFSDRGVEQSRRFRALKVWFALKTHGIESFAASIAGNIGQIAHLTKLADSSDRLEVVSRSDLNIVCFRYVRPGATADELNRLNQAVLTRLQVGGLAMPSHTVIDGKFVIRVANNNHRSELSDFDFLVEQVVAIGDELIAT
ncbi:putative Tyrosine decarboxylase 1 [Streptomyces afghaniensis 772]|uniref:Putative Tyrosine decarboxylase 1 n=1 Tax=Streptomyces afghaniensis 772 TaxID=1283301 RepID=S4M502_9ACTN|nr:MULTISPECIES: pyridoxal-dependent decarboxylase [Streptomyces]EPJ34268.1 putative Tyrosine decarboxylase 1 [Streptomyces afghaniensis 772]UOB09342.1 pyridoxal-dependent decarboxylase [Streptomyces sp. HP-A2021]